MKRKQFLWLGSAGLVALALPVYWRYFKPLEYDPRLAEPATLAQIWDKPTIMDMGKKYMELTGESSERALVTKLLHNSAEGPQLLTSLTQVISKDFEAGNIIQVEGWMLSRTEARQCALYSILHTQKQ